MEPVLRRLFVIAFICLHGHPALPQHPGNNQVKLSPVKLVDPVNPALQASYERGYAGHLSTQLTFAWMHDFFSLTDFTEFRGYRTGIEQKFFSRKIVAKRYRYYTSVEFVYLDVKYNHGSFYKADTLSTTPKYLDRFAVSKQHFSINLKQGLQIPIKRFMIDIGYGAGIKFKRTRREGVDNRQAYEIGPRHPNAYYIASKEGDEVAGNIPITIRIGYTF